MAADTPRWTRSPCPGPKNHYLPNGHDHQTAQLPIYLPGNGGLFTAVAAMATGSPSGFPAGAWWVHHEGLHALP